MTYYLGKGSLKALEGVHPDLVRVVKRAITLTTTDFSVTEGLRTLERQRILVAKGASTTMNSRHLAGTDGRGHAVDLVPYIDFNGDGKAELRWDWPLCYKVAEAMRQAAVAENVPIRWGGCWDRPLNSIHDVELASQDYVIRRKAEGMRAFMDGPHFELPSQAYP